MAPERELPPQIARLILLRSTHTNRELAKAFGATFAGAVPARSVDINRALTDATAAWPGDGLIWASVEGGQARILERPPRGVAFGR